MNLIGDHISLRLPTIEDVHIIHRWENDPEHWLVSNTIAPYTKEQILHFIEHDNDLYADQQMRMMIESKEGAVVGCIDLFDFDPKNHRVGLGILIDDAFRGKGLGNEAIALTVRYCFDELEMHSIYADVLENNASSQRLFEANGFVKAGHKKDWLWNGSEFMDQYFYQRIKEQ